MKTDRCRERGFRCLFALCGSGCDQRGLPDKLDDILRVVRGCSAHPDLQFPTLFPPHKPGEWATDAETGGDGEKKSE